jgi:hypothetical protein
VKSHHDHEFPIDDELRLSDIVASVKIRIIFNVTDAAANFAAGVKERETVAELQRQFGVNRKREKHTGWIVTVPYNVATVLKL